MGAGKTVSPNNPPQIIAGGGKMMTTEPFSACLGPVCCDFPLVASLNGETAEDGSQSDVVLPFDLHVRVIRSDVEAFCISVNHSHSISPFRRGVLGNRNGLNNNTIIFDNKKERSDPPHSAIFEKGLSAVRFLVPFW
ncbi:MAG: hypothetical protein Q7S80_00060 [bacterium]|nr:hypothetical protein [bacterium]